MYNPQILWEQTRITKSKYYSINKVAYPPYLGIKSLIGRTIKPTVPLKICPIKFLWTPIKDNPSTCKTKWVEIQLEDKLPLKTKAN